METNKGFIDKRAILGIVLVLLGFLVFAKELNWISFSVSNIIFSWQMILIIIGIATLNHKGHNAFSFILIAVGVILLAPKVFCVPFDSHRLFWPVIFVAIGLHILFHKKRDHRYCSSRTATESPLDTVDEVNIFGGSERKITSKSFRGGKITSIFGGSNFDMLDCELAEGKNVIDVVAIFGGTKMLIPSDWKVHIEVVSIFGGVADKRRSFEYSSSNKELYITGIVIFGGGEIKNI